MTQGLNFKKLQGFEVGMSFWMMMVMLVLVMMMVIVMVMMMVTPYRQNFGTNLFARASLKL